MQSSCGEESDGDGLETRSVRRLELIIDRMSVGAGRRWVNRVRKKDNNPKKPLRDGNFRQAEATLRQLNTWSEMLGAGVG